MYYNPETNECLSKEEVKLKVNASFPDGTEEVAGWHLIDEEMLHPHLLEDQIAVPTGIAFENDKWVRTYAVKQKMKLPETEDLHEKYAVLETAFLELAQIVSDLKRGA